MKDSQPLPLAALPSLQSQMEAVWRDRAHRLSQRPNLLRTAQDAVPVVVLGIGNERFGIELQDVAEVFPPVLPTPVPGARPVFSGVLNVHGEIRPVIDLRRLLGMETSAAARPTGELARVILLRKDGREMGLQIDSVEQVSWIAAGGGLGQSPHVSSHIKRTTPDRLMLLSTESLLAELDIT